MKFFYVLYLNMSDYFEDVRSLEKLLEEHGPPKNFIVLGGTGAGKSSFIADLLKITTAKIKARVGDCYDWKFIEENKKKPIPLAGRHYPGTTKKGTCYIVLVAGRRLRIADLPGLGDMNIQTMEMIDQIRNLTNGFLINGIIVVNEYGRKASFVDTFLARLLNLMLPVAKNA